MQNNSSMMDLGGETDEELDTIKTMDQWEDSTATVPSKSAASISHNGSSEQEFGHHASDTMDTWGSPGQEEEDGAQGEEPCPWCDGTGRSDGASACNECSGTGIETVLDSDVSDVWKFGVTRQFSGEFEDDREGTKRLKSPEPAAGIVVGDLDSSVGWGVAEEKLDHASHSRAATLSTGYLMLRDDALDSRRRQLAKDVQEQLHLSWDEADCVVRAGHWNTDAITNEWINDQQMARRKFGLAEASSERKVDDQSGESMSAGGVEGSTKVQCLNPMCDNDQIVSAKEARALGCGHWFCDDCWRMHLSSQIRTTGPGSVFAACMGFNCTKKGCRHRLEDECKCQLLIPQSWFEELMGAPGSHHTLQAQFERWKEWIRAKFVESAKDLQRCPTADCKAVYLDAGGQGGPLECESCGHRFCFRCRLDDHLPVPCDLASRFVALDTTDALTSSLIAATTKPCPKCKVPIEKNMACIHMTCINCRHDYCWICGENWNGHKGGYYSCSKYNESRENGVLSPEQQALMDNRQLLSKYQAHRELYNQTQSRLRRLLQFKTTLDRDETPFEVKKFLYRALLQLQGGLRLIQWSHCLTYFVRAGPQKRLFVFQQEALISLCHSLFNFLTGNSVSVLCESKNRPRITNEATIVESQRRKTIESLEQGQLIEAIQNVADKDAENWACGLCNKVWSLELDLEQCPGCTACRMHSEKQCWACFPRR